MFYKQLTKISFLDFKQIKIKSPLLFLTSILLVIPNQFFEYKKWNELVNSFSPNTSIYNKVKSYFSGNITGFITPNFIGNFIGRMYYFERRYRPKIIVLTLLANGSQFLTSIYFGILSISILGFKKLDLDPINPFYFSLLLLLTLIGYFNFDKILTPIKSIKKISIHLKNTLQLRYKLLIYSIIRYLIFSCQYFLILNAFIKELDIKLLLAVWSVYFFSTLTPSLFFGKIIIRETISIWILSQFIENTSIILVSSVVLWITNQGIPSVIGIPFLKKK